MIERYAKRVTDWLIECEVIEATDKALYAYAIYSLFLTLSPVCLAVFMGVLFGTLSRSILVILPFVLIRKFWGGYHAKKAGTCFVSSCLLLLLCVFISFYAKCDWILLTITILSGISLAYFSPLEHENRLLSDKEQIRYKQITAAIVACVFGVSVIFFCFCLYTYAVCISIGLILSASLQLPCVLRNVLRKGP